MMEERPFYFLTHQEPKSSGTPVSPTEENAMEGNSLTLPGLPHQPALGILVNRGGGREGGGIKRESGLNHTTTRTKKKTQK